MGEGVRGDYELCWSRWHQHYCEGLTAAANLFANETYNSIRFRKAEEFPQFDESLHSVLKAGEPACSYADWKQGFTLALLRFGSAGADASFVKETVLEYSADLDFIKRYGKEVGRVPRPMLSTLHQFAKDWDTFLVPLRYFTTAAALAFVEDQYHHGEDPTRFRNVFLKGGNKERHGWGLKLTGAKPPIVWVWSKHVIKLSVAAAATHGYDPAFLAKVLRERYERPVLV